MDKRTPLVAKDIKRLYTGPLIAYAIERLFVAIKKKFNQ